jgi:PRC-barrel domain protein
MADLDIDTVLGWRGRSVLDRDGEKIGSFGEVYLDRETDRPAFAGVNTGLFGRNEHIVPLDGMREDGGDLRVPYDRAQVHEAPQVDAETALDAVQEAEVFEHYGGGEAGAVAADHAGAPEDSAEVVRSEEEVDFSTRPTTRRERVRLRKVMVTDHVEQKVPVRREEVRVETDPPPEGKIVSQDDAGPA